MVKNGNSLSLPQKKQTLLTKTGGTSMGKLIRSLQEALDVLDDYRTLKPKRIAVDTETTGLYWPSDKLFLTQVGWGWDANYAFPASLTRIVRSEERRVGEGS